MNENDKEDKELCDICYESIKNKVILECTHEVCLKCIINILKIKSLSCPMCRKKYDISINDKEEQEELLFEIPYPYDINVVLQTDHNLRALIIQENIDDQCKFYEAYINNDELIFSFIIIHEVAVPDNIIEKLIYKLILNAIPRDLSLQYLRQDIVQEGQYRMKNTNHYIQDYYDTIIERIEII